MVALLAGGAVQAQAAQPTGYDCLGNRCVMGMSQAKSRITRGMLRVDAYARSGAATPSMHRVASQRDRVGTGWVYSSRRGWRAVKIRDMRVRVAGTRWDGWSKVKRAREGARWVYVADSDNAMEVPTMRCSGEIIAIVDADSACNHSSSNCQLTWGSRGDDMVDTDFHGLLQVAGYPSDRCNPDGMMPVKSREELEAGDGLLAHAGAIPLRDGSTWAQQRVGLEVIPRDGYEIDNDAVAQNLVCTISLRKPVLIGDGDMYQFSEIDTASDGTPIMATLAPGAREIILDNPTPAVPVDGHKMFIITCGMTRDVGVLVVRAGDPAVRRSFHDSGL